MGDAACGRAGRLERACARPEAGRGGPVLPQTGLAMCTSGSIRPCPLGLRHHLLHGVHRCALPLCATPTLACHGDSWRAAGSCPPPLPPPTRSPNAFRKDPRRSNPLSCCPTTPAEAYAGSFSRWPWACFLLRRSTASRGCRRKAVLSVPRLRTRTEAHLNAG